MPEKPAITGSPAELAWLASKALVKRDLNYLQAGGMDENQLDSPSPEYWQAVPAMYSSDFEEDMHVAFELLGSTQETEMLAWLWGQRSIFAQTAVQVEPVEGLALIATESGLGCSLRIPRCSRIVSIYASGSLKVTETTDEALEVPLCRDVVTAYSRDTYERRVQVIRGNFLDGQPLLIVGKLAIESYARNALNACSVFLDGSSKETAIAASSKNLTTGVLLDYAMNGSTTRA